MFASRGIVFSIEAVVAVTILLSLIIVLTSIPVQSNIGFKVQQDMQVAHDVIVSNTTSLPDGFSSNCAGSDNIANLSVSTRSVGVCMK